nr:adenosylcobinamide-GDP ribazoletransferase [uncultured Caproiciproducens sp.]
MNLLPAFLIAFSMYSAIPMPKAEWSRENMKYTMCFFPLTGGIIGLLLGLWAAGSVRIPIGSTLFAAVAVLIPVAVSGGIHLDGFCDTVDALSSHQTTERKLEILKDSHTGAFAIIGCVLYLLLDFALWTELKPSRSAILVLAVGFVLSRSLSGLSVVLFRCAKSSGLLASFSDAAAKNRVRVTMIVYLLTCAAVMLCASPWLGAAALIVCALMFLYYRAMSYRKFGGITGDLAGYFLQLCELFLLMAVVIAQKIL